ncbi:MAG: molybdopterin-dependent oxidoreductase [Chloroflexota bacterium]
MSVEFILNNQKVTALSHPLTPLLDVLRDELGLTGTKQGCDHEGECGACTVLVDGLPVRSCLLPVVGVEGRRVETIEGLSSGAKLHPLQQAFIEAGAVQCGFCTPGMILSAKALLDHNPRPNREQIARALDGNLCRCTGYARIAQAVELAAARLRGEDLFLEEGVQHSSPPLGGCGLRADSLEKVTGAAKYAEDIRFPKMLCMKVGRSPHFHARLKSLNIQRAEEVKGVRKIITFSDIPGCNGFEIYSTAEPVLPAVGDTLRMRGAPVFLVVAEDEMAAEAGLQAVEVVYEILPHTLEMAEALDDRFPLIGEESNVLSTFEVKHGDLEGAFRESDVILETHYETAFLEHAALEREALAGYLDEEGRITVIGGNHQPHNQQRYIAEALSLPLERVRVITPYTGGSFGGKQDPWPFVATALGVYTTRQPVRLVYSRLESFEASPKRHPYCVKYRIGAEKGGDLKGVYVRIDSNTGGYDSGGRYIPNYALTAAGGAYRWKAVDGLARSIYTNGPKSGQFRGFGTAQSTFALECTLDELAQKLQLDPLVFRLRNCLQEGQISFLGYPVAETLGYRETLEAIRPQYERFLQEAEEYNRTASGLRRGVGLAGMWYRFGKAGSLKIEAHAELSMEGHFVVYCSAPDYGQGTTTVMSQVAAEALGVSRDVIEIVNADTGRVPNSDIQGASRATYFVGGAVNQVVRTLRQAILEVAAEMLDIPVEGLTLQEWYVSVIADPARKVHLRQVAEEFDRIGKSRRVVDNFDLTNKLQTDPRAEYPPFFVTGVQIAEVQVDIESGEVKVMRMTAAHDVGRAVNPVDAAGQIEGAMVMGLGAALMEEYLPGITSGFSSYQIPTFSSMPEIEVILVESPSRFGPYGVKGLGEAAMLPSTPAIINAICRAIGQRIYSIPATPEKVYAAIRKGRE